MTFEDLLRAWGPDARAGDPRPGTHSGEVRSVDLGGVPCVGRLMTSDEASLAWELALLADLANLDGAGLVVPLPVPTKDGAPQHGGLVLTRKLPGGHPDSPEEWAAVHAALRRVHEATRGRAQRPGAAPFPVPGVVAAYGAPDAVVVGRTRRRDVTMTPDGPAFVDWSRARVDRAVLDLVVADEVARRAGLPEEVVSAGRFAIADTDPDAVRP
ncbi:MAG TPA: hypothetical protein VGX28_05750 [Frankiaceae bacterium]|jgi:hypothetical protein|nr:hypothetical protein [Frankiaceae bacterium]